MNNCIVLRTSILNEVNRGQIAGMLNEVGEAYDKYPFRDVWVFIPFPLQATCDYNSLRMNTTTGGTYIRKNNTKDKDELESIDVFLLDIVKDGGVLS